MVKKLLSLLLAVLMAATATCAFATSSPAVPEVVLPAVKTDVVYAEDFVVEAKELSAEAQAVLQTVVTLAETMPVAQLLDADTQEKITAVLPAEIPVTALTLDEVSTLNVENYKEEYGDVTIQLSVATAYEADEQLVVLVGVLVDGVMTWYPLEATVVDGAVQVVLTQEVMQLTSSNEAVIMVLRAEA